ncbi:MAG: hypothetical protein E7658_09825 [Ruminococcaceae bacterium]|nr:hypothetical protein [Oscillospiraceae bacterium]
MPCPMVHLGVAKQLCEKVKIENLSSFYLGTIAPDGIFTRPNFTREEKRINHLIPEDRERTIEDILLWLKDHLQFPDKSFILGYAVHVLTDQIFNQYVYPVFCARYDSDNSPVQNRQWAFYNDTDIVDFELYTAMEWRDEVWKHLENSNGIDVQEYLSAEEANSWCYRTLHWYDSGKSEHSHPVKYITFAKECKKVPRFITKYSQNRVKKSALHSCNPE